MAGNSMSILRMEPRQRSYGTKGFGFWGLGTAPADRRDVDFIDAVSSARSRWRTPRRGQLENVPVD